MRIHPWSSLDCYKLEGQFTVLGALCLVSGGGNSLNPVSAHAAFPYALESSSCGSLRLGWVLSEGKGQLELNTSFQIQI